VVLKRLTDAVRDGDRVLAVVRGSAVNQDGRSNGLTAPNTIAQQDVIRSALRSGRRDRRLGELHRGTRHRHRAGVTRSNSEALADQYGRGESQCALGAVKSNFGHLEAAAGIAGFIKAALSVQRAHHTAQSQLRAMEPAIDPSPTLLFVPTELSPWPARKARAGPPYRRSASAGRTHTS